MSERGPRQDADFFGSTIEELESKGPGARGVALVAEDTLFEHRGVASLNGNRLELEGWVGIGPDDVRGIRHEFIPEYSRLVAAGARGGFPSLGVFAKLGAPLIIDLKDRDSLVLLIGYNRALGTTRNTKWADRLSTAWSIPVA